MYSSTYYAAPKTAAVNIGLQDNAFAANTHPSKFTDFFKAICKKGSPAATFDTGNLWKLTIPGTARKNGVPPVSAVSGPQCFASSANVQHVYSKSKCFKDFYWIDLVDSQRDLAQILVDKDAIKDVLHNTGFGALPKQSPIWSYPVHTTTMAPTAAPGSGTAGNGIGNSTPSNASNATVPAAPAPAGPCATAAPTVAPAVAPTPKPPHGPCDPTQPEDHSKVPATIMADRVCVCFEGIACSNDCQCSNHNFVPSTDPVSRPFWWMAGQQAKGYNLNGSNAFWPNGGIPYVR